jgi:hypothetical protein
LKSAEAQALEKELKDIKMAIKRNVKMTDAANLVKMELSPAGQAKIEKEVEDVHKKWEEEEFNKPVRNFQNSLKRFKRSKEVAAIKKLDEQFMQTREGRKLAAEWGDFFEGMGEHVKTTQHGWHIDHDGVQIIEDELDDIKHEYLELKDGVWHNKFKAAIAHAKASKDGKQLKRRIDLFEKSAEAQALEKELKDIKMAIKRNVKMTDAANLVKMELSPAGQAKIEKEVEDVHKKWEEEEFNKPVRNFQNSLKRFKRSKEVAAIKKLDEQFMQTREGRKLAAEWGDFFEGMGEHVKTTQHGWHIDHDGVQIIEDELDDIKHEYLELKDGVWHNKFKAAIAHAKASKDGKQLKRRIDLFEKSAEAQALEKELKDIKMAIKRNVKMTDAANLVKMELSPAGQAAIEKEVEDVHKKWEEEEFNKPVRNFQNSLKRFKRSKEVAAIKKLDEEFMQTREGKKLYYEWRDFFEGMDEHVKSTPQGMHIDHDGVQIIEDELDDLKHEYMDLKDGVWHNKFKAAIAHAKASKDGQQLKRRVEHFEKSAEAQALEKELKEVKEAIQ